jgi:DNA-binding CsgD family transcriptional regulator
LSQRIANRHHQRMSAHIATPLIRLPQAVDGRAGPRPGPLSRALIALALVVGALLLADAARSVLPAGGLFLILLLPVLAVSTAMGARWGLLALVLGVLGSGLLVVVREHPWLTDPIDVVRLLLYVSIGGAIVSIASAPRSAERRAVLLPAPEADPLSEALTQRETQVLGLAARGLSTNEIAGRLYLSPNTVKSHLAHAYSKLGARNRAEAVVAALRVRAIDVDAPTPLERAPWASPDRGD